MRALQLGAKMAKTYYNKPLIVTYSGGKDSDVMLHIAEKCLEPSEYIVRNSHTSVDAPETVYHIREVFKRLNDKGINAEVHIPRYKDGTQKTMWNLIPRKKMPPTRIVRYCCKELKESDTKHDIVAVGVRASESRGRQGRDIFGTAGTTKKDAKHFALDHAEEVYEESLDNDPVWDCTLIENARKNKELIVNPIYEWTDDDIWDYIKQEKIKVNPLYTEGFKRIGCVGCPLSGPKNMQKEFERWPAYRANYIKAFERMLKIRQKNKLATEWETGEDIMTWWLGGDPNQMTIDKWLKEVQDE